MLHAADVAPPPPIHGSLHILVDPVIRLVMRYRRLRWAKFVDRGDGDYIEERNKCLRAPTYVAYSSSRKISMGEVDPIRVRMVTGGDVVSYTSGRL